MMKRGGRDGWMEGKREKMDRRYGVRERRGKVAQ